MSDKGKGETPWATKTAPDRVAPRECVANARRALDASYAITDRAPIPLLVEALDWLRRALEQMAPDAASALAGSPDKGAGK